MKFISQNSMGFGDLHFAKTGDMERFFSFKGGHGDFRRNGRRRDCPF